MIVIQKEALVSCYCVAVCLEALLGAASVENASSDDCVGPLPRRRYALPTWLFLSNIATQLDALWAQALLVLAASGNNDHGNKGPKPTHCFACEHCYGQPVQEMPCQTYADADAESLVKLLIPYIVVPLG